MPRQLAFVESGRPIGRVSSQRPMRGAGGPTRAQQSNADQQMSFRNRWSSSTSSRIASGSRSRSHWHSSRPAASPSPSGAAARAALIAYAAAPGSWVATCRRGGCARLRRAQAPTVAGRPGVPEGPRGPVRRGRLRGRGQRGRDQSAHGDLVNLGLARAAGLPVVVVGDVDRAGVFAATFGPWRCWTPPTKHTRLAGWSTRSGGTSACSRRAWTRCIASQGARCWVCCRGCPVCGSTPRTPSTSPGSRSARSMVRGRRPGPRRGDAHRRGRRVAELAAAGPEPYVDPGLGGRASRSVTLLPAAVRFGRGNVLDRPVGEALGERVGDTRSTTASSASRAWSARPKASRFSTAGAPGPSGARRGTASSRTTASAERSCASSRPRPPAGLPSRQRRRRRRRELHRCPQTRLGRPRRRSPRHRRAP
jgi:hypothetical protein